MKTLKLLFLLTVLIISSTTAHTQDRWAAVFGDNGAEFAYDIRTTSDGGFIVSGYGSDGGTSDYYLIKLNLNGLLEWEKTLSLSNYSERGFSVTETNDGGFVVFGNGGAGNYPYAVKFDAAGDSLWTTRQWSEQLPYHRAVLAYGTELADGRLAMITLDNMNKPWRYLISAEGELLQETGLTSIVPPVWYNGTFTNDLEPASDGGFIIAGATGAGPGNSAFLWKFDANADSVWSKTYGPVETGMLYAQSVKQTSDGGYIVTGSGNYNSSAAAAFRTDGSGNLLWANTYADTTSNYRTGADIVERPDGSFMMIENKFSAFGTTIFKSELLNLNESGNLISRVPVIGSDTSTRTEYIINTTDGGYTIAGWLKNVRDVSESDLYILKVNANGVQPECVFDCVWPGDADNSGIVEMADLMTLGLSAGLQGPARENPSLNWFGQNAIAWADTLPGGLNAKYTDCNGDGISNADDTTAIIQNYTFTHPVNPFKSGGKDAAPLYINPEEYIFTDDVSVQIPVYLGTAEMPVEDFYGAMFHIYYESEWVEPGSMRISFGPSWVAPDGEAVALGMNNPYAPLVEAGITRMDHSPVDGEGRFATLMFKLKEGFDQVPDGEIEVMISFENISAHTNTPQPIAINGGSFQVLIPAGITSAREFAQEDAFRIFPNPVAGNLINILANAEEAVFYLFDHTGRLMMSRNLNYDVNNIPLAGIAPGMYIIRITGKNGENYTEKLIVN